MLCTTYIDQGQPVQLMVCPSSMARHASVSARLLSDVGRFALCLQ